MFGVVVRVERFTENYFEYKRHKTLTHDRTLPEVRESKRPKRKIYSATILVVCIDVSTFNIFRFFGSPDMEVITLPHIWR